MVPAAVAAALIPLRSDEPNTDIALVLVLCVGAVAMVGGPWAAVVGALAGATAFDLLDAPPYGQLYMTRGKDVVTTLVLVGAGLLVAELCIRMRAYRGAAVKRAEDFTVLGRAARLMAVGEDGPMVVEALAGELVSRLALNDCEFADGPPPGDRPYVGRDGRVVPPETRPPAGAGGQIDLPVWAGSQVVGYYRLYVSPGPPPPRTGCWRQLGSRSRRGPLCGVARHPSSVACKHPPVAPAALSGRPCSCSGTDKSS